MDRDDLDFTPHGWDLVTICAALAIIFTLLFASGFFLGLAVHG